MARFSLGQNLSQRPELTQALLPRMLQSIEVLALPIFELAPYLEKLGQENEALTVEAPSVPAESAPRRLDWQATSDHDEMLRNQPAPEKSVSERIEEQLALIDLEASDLEWVRFLVSCLDDNGYLSAEDEVLLELAEGRDLEGGLDSLASAIARLQKMEPRGIGARDAIEALLLQIDVQEPDYEKLCRLLEEFVDELAKNRQPMVAKALGVSLEELTSLVDRLRNLNPRPAADMVASSAPLVSCDVRIDRGPEGFEITVDQSGLPGVSIDDEVARIAREKDSSRELKDYLRQKLDVAKWVVDAVEQRKETLLRIATRLFHHQRPFLEEGPGHLLPCRMNELAEELDLHVSTVSRAVAGKYVQTPWGIHPLRYFFQAAAGGGAETARDDLRTTVKQVFDGEDPREPYSDDDVVRVMKERGHDLARRTVAKYRKELGIPSSYRRRRFE